MSAGNIRPEELLQKSRVLTSLAAMRQGLVAAESDANGRPLETARRVSIRAIDAYALVEAREWLEIEKALRAGTRGMGSYQD